MTKLSIAAVAALLALTGVVTNATQTSSPQDPVLDLCEVRPEEEIMLPAEEAGVLVQLAVKEGSAPTAGQVLGLIDDRQAKLQMDAAKFGHDAASARFNSQIEIQYAEESAKVAEAEYRRMLEANKQTSNAVAQIEVERAKLQWNTTQLQIKKAEHDKEVAGFDVGAKLAEYQLADLGMKRRTLLAPFDGVVVALFRHQNEWVNPGDPILHYMRLNTMRVEKYIDQSRFDPQELDGCNVTVEVKLARGRPATFTGRVTLVSPQLDLHNQYLVRAEVANRQEAGRWILPPNSQATMTIHLGTGRGTGVGMRGQ